LKKQSIEIVWFKRDLRISDHKPLYNASLAGVPLLPLYVIEPDYWAQPSASRRHWCFINDCLNDLSADCSTLGQPLIIKVGEIRKVFEEIHNEFNILTIHSHEETGGDWTYKRDILVREWCRKTSINLVEYPNNGIVRGLQNRDEWAKIRNRRVHEKITPTPERIKPIRISLSDTIPLKNDLMFGLPIKGKVQKGGRKEAILLLKSFTEARGRDYLLNISSPVKSDRSCSRISTHLTWGTITVKEILNSLGQKTIDFKDSKEAINKRNLSAFKSRLAWRCHFIQKLEDQPNIEFKCMHELFEGLRENDFNTSYFDAWCKGKTGFPFIDACMRFLMYNGWITFRARALLVSFASYNLWLDWRMTGPYLAKLFTDFEPGIHFSQLQMQSGVTGINAIRIYNPIKQSYDQDKNGLFIKKWLPELQNVPLGFIHQPWLMNDTLQDRSRCMIGKDYPHPIIEYKPSYNKAKERIRKVREEISFNKISKNVFKNLGSRKSRIVRSKSIKSSSQMSFDL